MSNTGGSGATIEVLPKPDPIHVLMPRVMADIGSVGKGDRNTQQGYSFRGIDRVMNAVHVAMIKHGVSVTPKVLDKEFSTYTTSKGTEMRVAVVTVEYTFWGPSGDSVIVITLGEASDAADKATNKALSAALKYALLHTFVVPTEDVVADDADRHSLQQATRSEGKAKRSEAAPAKKAEPQDEPTHNLTSKMTAKVAGPDRQAFITQLKDDYDVMITKVPESKREAVEKLIESWSAERPFSDDV